MRVCLVFSVPQFSVPFLRTFHSHALFGVTAGFFGSYGFSSIWARVDKDYRLYMVGAFLGDSTLYLADPGRGRGRLAVGGIVVSRR